MSAAGRFGAVLAALWTAHDLGDHVVQTDEQAAGKALGVPASWAGPMLGHLASYHATQVAALAALRPLGVRPSWRRTALAVAWSAVTHGVLDRRWPVVALLDATGSARFARPEVSVRRHPVRVEAGEVAPITGPLPLHGPYLADQALHHAALMVAALILATGKDKHR